MKLVWKLAIPQICIVVCLGLISFIVIDASFDKLRHQYTRSIAGDQMQSLAKRINFSSQKAADATALFVELPVVLQAYEIALSGDIDDPNSPQSQQARELLREKLAPMLNGYRSITGKRFQLHFHLPNGRSLVRLWRDKNTIAAGMETDISDDLSAFRHTVMRTNRTGTISMGIESDIGGIAIRAVMPVTAPDGRHLGSAEVVQSFTQLLDTMAYPFALYANSTLLDHAADLQCRKAYPLNGNFVRLAGLKDSSIEALVTPALLERGKDGLIYEDYAQGTLAAFPLNDFQGRQAGVVVLALNTRSFSATAQYTVFILAIMLAAMVAAPACALLLSIRAWATRPLGRIKSMIQDIAEDRADLTSQIPANQTDEIGDLVRWFNTLTAKLADLLHERQAMFERIHNEYEMMKYRLTSNALGIAHWDLDILNGEPLNPNNKFKWSPELRKMFGFTESVIFTDVLANWTDRLHPDEREEVLRNFAAHVNNRAGKGIFNFEHRMRMNNGECRYVRVVGSTLRDKNGLPLHVTGAVEDITRQRKTQNELCEMTKRIKLMMDSVPLAITMWDKNLHVVDCSNNTMQLLQFDNKQTCVDTIMDCAPEFQPGGRPSREVMIEHIRLAFEQGYAHCEYTHQTLGGELIVFDVPLVRMEYEDDFVVVAYARDIREDKKMLANIERRDKMMEEQAHWYKSILDAIPLPCRVTDNDMNLTFINIAAESLFGKKHDDLIGQPCRSLGFLACGTDDCCVARAKRGLKQTFFKYNDMSCQVDTEIIQDVAGATSGFIEILHDVTEVEKAARRQADEANEAKSAFLATISHEMRTPLNAVIGLSELTIDSGDLSAEAEANLENIYNAGSTLLSIVNDILDLSKIKSGKFEIIPNHYDVPSMVNDAITQNLLRIGSKPIRFILDIDENMPARLYGDDLRVKQIIANLLSNAFKYTEKGTVELGLSCEREGESVWMSIRVSDTGVGVRQEDYARLFSDYAQIDAKANRKAGGTGLGLSITKNLAKMMDGDVSITSTYGQGSVFTVKLRQGFVNDAVIGADLAENLRKFRYATSKRSRNARLNRIRLPYARVLVVDDHLTNLDVAKGLMRPYGMQIDCVTSGQEAVDAIREEKIKYNAVFMDHMMPEMDGMEATRLIRALGTEYAANIPIIALTANAIVGTEELFLRNGFTAFISKPIELICLDDAIRRFVRDKKQEALIGLGEAEISPAPERRKGRNRRAADRRDDSGAPLAGKKIEGLNLAKGLELFGEAEAYVMVLRSYAINTKPLLASIREVEPESLLGYAITVHGIKGSSRGICAEAAGSLAEELELAAKAGDFNFVRDHNPAFLENVENLVRRIETLLSELEPSPARPEKDKPDSALLARLQTACANYDLDGIDAVMREIDGYAYTADEGLAAWLHDNIISLNYSQIIEKIAQL